MDGWRQAGSKNNGRESEHLLLSCGIMSRTASLSQTAYFKASSDFPKQKKKKTIWRYVKENSARALLSRTLLFVTVVTREHAAFFQAAYCANLLKHLFLGARKNQKGFFMLYCWPQGLFFFLSSLYDSAQLTHNLTQRVEARVCQSYVSCCVSNQLNLSLWLYNLGNVNFST